MNERINVVTSVGQLGSGFDYRSPLWERITSAARLARVASNEEDACVARTPYESRGTRLRKTATREFSGEEEEGPRPFSAYA